jgi:hypothetical protein
MAASLQSILQGLSSVLGVAVVALLPVACDSSGDLARGADRPYAAVIEAAPTFSGLAKTEAASNLGSPKDETPICIDKNNDSQALASCQPGQPEDRASSRPPNPASHPGS